MKIERSKEWWLRKARLEGDSEVGVGGSILRVADRLASEVSFQSKSDNPAVWETLTKDWSRAKAKVRKTKPFKGFVMHWAPGPGKLFFDTVTTTLETSDSQQPEIVVGVLNYGLEEETDAELKGAVSVDPNYRRKGIASAMYAWAEDLAGREFIPEPEHTPYAQALWGQKNRPFGRKHRYDR
jgi:hypothetical protein